MHTVLVVCVFPAYICAATCADLVSAAAATTTGNIAGNFVEDIVCDEWTDINITQNTLTLYGESTSFTKARFVVSDGAILRAEVLVSFTGDGVLEVRAISILNYTPEYTIS